MSPMSMWFNIFNYILFNLLQFVSASVMPIVQHCSALTNWRQRECQVKSLRIYHALWTRAYSKKKKKFKAVFIGESRLNIKNTLGASECLFNLPTIFDYAKFLPFTPRLNSWFKNKLAFIFTRNHLVSVLHMKNIKIYIGVGRRKPLKWASY